MALEFLQIVQETAYQTTNVAPVAGTSSIYIRLMDSNRFTPRPQRDLKPFMYGGGVAIRHYTASDKFTVTGRLSLELCGSQAAFLLAWAGTRINAGRTLPWTTTDASGVMPVGDLASCSIYHAITRSDGTIKRRKYRGMKVHSWSLSTSDEAQLVMLDLDLQGATVEGNPFDGSSDPDATVFPQPVETAWPTDPYLFTHTSG